MKGMYSQSPSRWNSLLSSRGVKASVPLPAIILSLLVAPLAAFAAGALDESFGVGGIVTQDFGEQDSGAAVLVQPGDARIVMAGTAITAGSRDIALVRYLPDGALDTSFGQGGVVTTPAAFVVYDAALQADGNIVVAGGGADINVVRYNPDGSLDTSFGGSGMVTTDVEGSTDRANAVIIQPDGKIVVAGVAYIVHDGGLGRDFVLIRYNSDGSLDTSFDTDGIATAHFGSNEEAWSVALQSDGKIVVGGEAAASQFSAARFNPDGTLDTAFGNGGLAAVHIRGVDVPFDVALQPDGKILLGGNSSTNNQQWDFALARFDATGSLDTTFGTNGTVETDLGGSERIYALALQPGGEILAAGQTLGGHFTLARYHADGSLDTTFGSGGVLTTPIGNSSSASDMAFQSADRLLVGGTTQVPVNQEPYSDFALARYRTGPTCYTLTVEANPPEGGQVDVRTAPDCNQGTQYTPGTVVTLSAKQNSHFAFSHWSGEIDDTHRHTTIIMDADRTATANFNMR